MEVKTKEYSLKLPSSAVVTVKNVWEVLGIISKTGKVFTEADLIKNNSPVNEKNLFRILSYLKYLGFVYEKRERENINGKEQVSQRWFEEEKKDITDFFFYLRDNRESEAKKIFIKIVKQNDLYNSIKDELIKQRPSTTIIELKDFFRNKNPGKTPGYYDTGVKFVVELLLFCNLITKEGNIVKLLEEKAELQKIDILSDKKETNLNLPKKEIGNNKYFISIVGENNHNFEFPINNLSDIEDVESILNIIKKKLN